MGDKKTKRKGMTLVTSVSISKEFKDLLDKYEFSPTEVFRRGMAVMLADAGESKYLNKKNLERKKIVEDFLNQVKINKKLNELFNKLAEVSQLMRELNQEGE